jgi:hypothetical protein
VDGSELARTFFTFAALVGAAMCSACSAAGKGAGHNALRGSGPVNSTHSTMRWHKWVVLIAGSTGALFAEKINKLGNMRSAIADRQSNNHRCRFYCAA